MPKETPNAFKTLLLTQGALEREKRPAQPLTAVKAVTHGYS